MATAVNVPRALSVGDLLDVLDRFADAAGPESTPEAVAVALRHFGDHAARLCVDEPNRPLDVAEPASRRKVVVGSSAGEGGLQGRAHDVAVGLDAGP